jgi:hypothetical protein
MLNFSRVKAALVIGTRVPGALHRLPNLLSTPAA